MKKPEMTDAEKLEHAIGCATFLASFVTEGYDPRSVAAGAVLGLVCSSLVAEVESEADRVAYGLLQAEARRDPQALLNRIVAGLPARPQAEDFFGVPPVGKSR